MSSCYGSCGFSYQVLTSGWLFEPVATKDGKVYTLITYIVQVSSQYLYMSIVWIHIGIYCLF